MSDYGNFARLHFHRFSYHYNVLMVQDEGILFFTLILGLTREIYYQTDRKRQTLIEFYFVCLSFSIMS